MGRKMALDYASTYRFDTRMIKISHADAPQEREEDHHDDCQDFRALVLCLLINLNEAVDEGREPEEPFEQCGQHD